MGDDFVFLRCNIDIIITKSLGLQRLGLFLSIPSFRFGRRGFGRSRSRCLIFLKQNANYRRRTFSTKFSSVGFLVLRYILYAPPFLFCLYFVAALVQLISVGDLY